VYETVDRKLDLLIAFFLFGICLPLYLVTLTPGLPHPAGDSHEFIMSSAELRLARRTGYPIYTWLGFLFIHIVPIGDVAYRMNLMSALFGAVAVVMLYFVARRLQLRPAIAAFAVLAFGVSTTFWSRVVVAEVYTLNIFMLGIVIWLLLSWSERRTTKAFVLFALAFGVSLGAHMSNAALGLVFALFVLLHDPRILRKPRLLTFGLLAFLLGIVQFIWVPLMADTAPFPNPRPDSLIKVYKYTLGAFSNLRFAYPMHALPGRFLFYVSLLVDNFTVLGIAVGLVGMGMLLLRQPKNFVLFFGIFFVNVGLAMQVFASEIEVFFMPSYISWAVFLGFGIQAICEVVQRLAARLKIPRGSMPERMAYGFLLLLLACWVVIVGRTSFAENDRSNDTTFEDFYDNALAMLPRDSVLVPLPGVFGQGVFYYEKVLGLRPDVEIPNRLRHRLPTGVPLFTTLNIVKHEARPHFASAAFPKNPWFVPVLFGNGQGLKLYRVDRRPPKLLVRQAAAPNRVNRPVGNVTLVSFAYTIVKDAPRARVHLETYWRLSDLSPHYVSTKVDETIVESHKLGFDNLSRYVEEVRPSGDELLAEVYDVVLPSSAGRGDHELELGVTQLRPGGDTTWIGLGSFSIDRRRGAWRE
jgi:hypothetical protein